MSILEFASFRYGETVKARKLEIDIFKCLLIYAVVLGHTGVASMVERYIFWFHMPAFFMLSGYLTRFDEPLTQFTKKKFIAYIIPYFSYSILFYAIFRPENVFKNILRVVYGGINNTTIYSYPYWYINCLFVGLIVYCFLRQRSKPHFLSVIIIGTWIIVHVFVSYISRFPLPWGLDTMMVALMFIYIGDMVKGRHICSIISVFLSLFLVLLGCVMDVNITFNMKSLHLNNVAVDLLVPVVFTAAIYYLSCVTSKIMPDAAKSTFTLAGKSCMTIFYTHTLFMSYLKPLILNPYILSLVIVVLGVITYCIFDKSPLLRLLFNGKK